MYKTVYYLGIRDKKDWNKWSFSKEYETIDACFNAAKEWLAENPGRVISFMTRKVFTAPKEEES